MAQAAVKVPETGSRIVEFEGRRIEVPTDATDDDIRFILSQPQSTSPGTNPFDQFDPPASEPGAKAAPSLVDTIMSGARAAGSALDTAAYFPRGARRGLANIVGLPVDAMNAGLSLVGVPVSQKPFLGSKFLDDALGGFGALPDIPPASTATQRALGRVGEEVGAAAVPVATAVRAGQMGEQAARELPAVARMFVEPAAINPTRFVKKEGLSAVAAGGGAAGANELTRAGGAKDGGLVHNAGDIAGALAGAGVLGAARIVGPAAGDIVAAVTARPRQTSRVVQEAVADRLIENVTGAPLKPGDAMDTQPIIDAINRGKRVSDTIPGYRDTLADRTQDPGLAALEYSRVSGPNSGEFAQRRVENTAAIDNSFAALEPQGSPAALREALTTERGRRLTDAAVVREAAQGDLDAVAQRLAPSSPYAEDRGAAVRAGVQNAEQAARETERAAWQGIGGDVDPAPLAGRFDQVTAGMPVARQQVVADLENALGIPAGFDRAVNVQEITALRSRLTTAQRNALRGPQPDANRASAIGQYIDELDAFMTRSGLPEDTLRRTELARGVSHDVNERFNRPNDPLAAVLSTKEGRPDVPDAAVARRFVQPDSGQTSNLGRLLAETDLSSHAQSTRQGIRDEVLADIQARGLVGQPDALDQYLNSRTAMFSRFPGLRDEIAQAGVASRRVHDATAAEGTLQRELGTADRVGTGAVGQYLRFGDERAEAAFDTVLRSKEPGKAATELLTFANNDPQAVEGARKAFWNVMQKRARSAGETTATVAGAQPWMPHALKRFLDDPATVAVAERLYRDNPEHLADIRKIAEALQGVDLRSRARAPNTSGTAQGINNVLTPETIQSRFLSYKRGQIGAPFLITSLAAVAARRSVRKTNADAINSLLDNALLDPELAAQLLKENNPANRAAMARTAKAYLGNEASTLFNMLDGDDEDPVKRAVMRKEK